MKIDFYGLNELREELEERRACYKETLVTAPIENKEWYATEIANITKLLEYLAPLTEQTEISVK